MTKAFSELGIEPAAKSFIGPKIEMDVIMNQQIIVHDFHIVPSRYPKKEGDMCMHLQITFEDKKRVVFTVSTVLMEMIQRIPESAKPFTTTIKKDNRRFIFT